jgi:hypothetical protein
MEDKQVSRSFFEKKEPKKLLSAWRSSVSAPVIASAAKQSILSLSTNTLSGLKLPNLAANRSQNEQKFFWFFFFKKRTPYLNFLTSHFTRA